MYCVVICNCKMHLKLLFIVTIALTVRGISQDEIRTKLLDNYDIHVPPILDAEKPLVVGVGMTMNHFDLEENEKLFTANTWMRLSWNDHRLKYNSTNQGVIRFSNDEVWKPDLTLYNNAFATEVDHYGDTHILVSPDGTVLWVPPSRLVAHCNLNLIKWPYDTQVCELKFGSWTHHGKEIDLVFIPGSNESHSQSAHIPKLMIEHTSYISNSEWKLISNSVVRNALYYDCCPEPYIDLTFSFTIQRVSPAYTATFVIPILLVSLINTMLFLLPPTSGEKLFVTSINFLIISIFLIFVHAKVPPLGDHLPLLVLLYVINMVLIFVFIAITILVINLSRVKRISRPPYIFRILCNVQLASILGIGHLVPFVSKTHSRLNEDRVEMQARNGTTTNWQNNCNGIERETSSNQSNENEYKNDFSPSGYPPEVEEDTPFSTNNAEWILLATSIDRISFIIYLVVNTIVLSLCLT